MASDGHHDRCVCDPCIVRTITEISMAAENRGALTLRVAQLQALVDRLTEHIDTWAHTMHRSYHAGSAGYFSCTMPGCVESALIVRQMEKH